jgi:hypothetical protein
MQLIGLAPPSFNPVVVGPNIGVVVPAQPDTARSILVYHPVTKDIIDLQTIPDSATAVPVTLPAPIQNGVNLICKRGLATEILAQINPPTDLNCPAHLQTAFSALQAAAAAGH